MDRLVDVIEQYFIENQEDTADVDLQDTNNQIKVSFFVIKKYLYNSEIITLKYNNYLIMHKNKDKSCSIECKSRFKHVIILINLCFMFR